MVVQSKLNTVDFLQNPKSGQAHHQQGMLFSRFVCTQVHRILGRHLKVQTSRDSNYHRAVNFVHRILRMTAQTITLPFIISALRYVERIANSPQGNQVGEGAEVYLFGIALMVAHKSYSDHCYSNKTFSHIFRLPLNDLNSMEFELLASLKFDLVVKPEEYYKWFDQIQEDAKEWYFDVEVRYSVEVYSTMINNKQKIRNDTNRRKSDIGIRQVPIASSLHPVVQQLATAYSSAYVNHQSTVVESVSQNTHVISPVQDDMELMGYKKSLVSGNRRASSRIRRSIAVPYLI